MKAYVYKVVIVLPDGVDPGNALDEAFGSDAFANYLEFYNADWKLLDAVEVDHPNVPADTSDDVIDKVCDAWHNKSRDTIRTLLRRN